MRATCYPVPGGGVGNPSAARPEPARELFLSQLHPHVPDWYQFTDDAAAAFLAHDFVRQTLRAAVVRAVRSDPSNARLLRIVVPRDLDSMIAVVHETA